ncbi:hypothetical protein POTOM_019494 [Populus tomentosa]|uniref:Uncharacterized protein n=1 Tax=Populus tomentosa TaxID=118781 RepID=A0A8X7ZVQ8_POPTO|nr:hypothetical protein POTOM_019494 [Populus tomentosa]
MCFRGNWKALQIACGAVSNMHPLDTEDMETQDDEAYAIATTMPKLKRLEMAYHLFVKESFAKLTVLRPFAMEYFYVINEWEEYSDDYDDDGRLGRIFYEGEDAELYGWCPSPQVQFPLSSNCSLFLSVALNASTLDTVRACCMDANVSIGMKLYALCHSLIF